MMFTLTVLAVAAFALATSAPVSGDVSPLEFGLKADGSTDDTSAVQRALNKAAEEGGGVVQLPSGQIRIEGNLVVPRGVTLQGVWKGPHYSSPEVGTTLLAFGGRGSVEGPPLIMLETNSTVRGITIYYPEQQADDVQPYPWTIQGRGTHLNVIDVTLLNPYMGIDFGTYGHEMHYIRNVYGIPLKIGVHLDKCTDIGRVENVHFNPNSWTRSGTPTAPTGDKIAKLVEYLQGNLVAFELGRSDWEFMMNTFVWGAKVGYRFYTSENGATNGNFLGIAADWCVTPLLIEGVQEPGLLITNGEFVGSPMCEAAVRIEPSHAGVVQLSNCSFWGPHRQIARVEGRGVVSLSQCNFVQWAESMYAVEALGGTLLLQACRFRQGTPHVRLGPQLESAVVMGNLFRGGPQIANESSGDVQILGNATLR